MGTTENNNLLVQWIQGVYEELKTIREDQNTKFNEVKDLVHTNKEVIDKRLSGIERDFLEFKTKTNTRTAVISAVFSVIVSGAALLYTLIKLSESIPK
jgi:hypothetical protein